MRRKWKPYERLLDAWEEHAAWNECAYFAESSITGTADSECSEPCSCGRKKIDSDLERIAVNSSAMVATSITMGI